MTPQEQKMLDDLIARVDGTRLEEKDADATQRIEEWSGRNPDATYILAQTVLVQNARTLEDLVREMLRPMLRSWLDENLPGLVERLVRAEIERVARGH